MTIQQPVYLAPMVRGSELAMRMLARKHGVSVCYGPMLRAHEVVMVHKEWKMNKAKLISKDTISRKDGYMCIADTCSKDTRLVIQICGRCPDELSAATKALIDIYDDEKNGYPALEGIDLNLGCPQDAAEEHGFGAFLAERDPAIAIQCIKAMRRTMDELFLPLTKADDISNKSKPRLSCKIRLLEDISATVKFAQALEAAGCEMIAVHCRRRSDKHNGKPDFEAGAKIVKNVNIPVVINGDVRSLIDAEKIIQSTGAHAVMAASGFLENPRMLRRNKEEENVLEDHDPAFLAAEYLDFAEKYPPPSPLYIRKHLRWIFRPYIQPERNVPLDYSAWQPRLWTFLVRPYLETMDQFRQVVHLYVNLNGSKVPPSLANLPIPTFKSIRNGRRKRNVNGDLKI